MAFIATQYKERVRKMKLKWLLILAGATLVARPALGDAAGRAAS